MSVNDLNGIQGMQGTVPMPIGVQPRSELKGSPQDPVPAQDPPVPAPEQEAPVEVDDPLLRRKKRMSDIMAEEIAAKEASYTETLKRWVAQQGADIANVAKGIPAAALAVYKGYTDAPKHLYNIAKDTIDLVKSGNAEQAYTAYGTGVLEAADYDVKTSKSGLLNAITEHYRDSDGEFTLKSLSLAPLKRPFLVGLDLLGGVDAVVSVGKGIAKMNAVAKASEAARAAKAAGRVLPPDFEIRLARRLEQKYSAPYERLRRMPIDLAAAPIKKLVDNEISQSFLKKIGWDKASLDANSLMARSKMLFRQSISNTRARLLFHARKVSPDRWEAIKGIMRGHISGPELREFMVTSTKEERTALQMANRLERDLSGYAEKLGIEFESGRYSPALKRGAKRKHIAGELRRKAQAEMQSAFDGGAVDDSIEMAMDADTPGGAAARGGDFSHDELTTADLHYESGKKTFDELKGEYPELKAAEYDDFFLSHVASPDIPNTWKERIKYYTGLRSYEGGEIRPAAGKQKQDVNFVDRYTDSPKFKEVDNPFYAVDKVAMERAETYGTLHGYNRILDEHAKPLAPGDEPLPGYVAGPNYFPELQNHAENVIAVIAKERMPEVINAAPEGASFEAILDSPQFKKMAEQISGELTDKFIETSFDAKKWNIQLPKGVARAMEIDLEPVGMIGRFADNWLDRWRYMVLNGTPRFYVNNVLTNGVLLALYGDGGPLLGYSKMLLKRMGKHLSPAELPAEAGYAMSQIEFDELVSRTTTMKIKALVDRRMDDLISKTDRLPRELLFNAEMESAIKELGNAQRLAKLLGTSEDVKKLTKALSELHKINQVESGYLIPGLRVDLEAHKAAAATDEATRLNNQRYAKELFDEADPNGLNLKLDRLYGRALNGYNAQNKSVHKLWARLREMQQAPEAILAQPKYKQLLATRAAELDVEMKRFEKAMAYKDRLMGEMKSAGFEFDADLSVLKRPDMVPSPEGPAEAGFLREQPDLASMRQSVGRAGESVTESEYARIAELHAEAKRPRTREFLQGRVKADVHQRMLNSARRRLWQKKYAPAAEVVDRAIGVVEQFLGAYGKMTPFTRKYLRRVIPFWTFQKTMMTLAAQLPLIRPKTSILLHRMGQLAMDAMDREDVPESLRGSYLIGVKDDGKLIFGNTQGISPLDIMTRRTYGGIPGLTSFGRLPIPALLNPEQSPFLMVAHKSIGGVDVFSNPEPLRPGDFSDSIGRRWHFNGKELVQTSPQSLLVETIMEMTPQTSLALDIMSWLGMKGINSGYKSWRGPGGETIQPDYIKRGLMKYMTGYSETEIDPEQMRRTRRRRVIRTVRSIARSSLYEVNEADREQVLKIAKDIIKAEQARERHHERGLR